jgi:uncharacterized protein
MMAKSGSSGLMDNKEISIQYIKKQLGWAYSQLKWPLTEEIAGMNEVRNNLLQDLSNDVINSYFQNKLHIGSLSPGCVACGDGAWLCLFINQACTANCFYCPQNRKTRVERPPMVDELSFRNPLEFADYAHEIGARGISFSGGEPLLAYPVLLAYIEELRRKMGREVYLWVYTNGDLIDKEKLVGLKKAGLDEIRVDISARNYDLGPVEMAMEYFDMVSIEIPAIPEDLEQVKSTMRAMKNVGLRYLNLHQLLTTEYNYPNLASRNYTFLHHPGLPVFESEITALQLLQYSVENNLLLQVNYCAQSYKERIHSRNHRLKAMPYARQDFEDSTEAMYIRNISVQAKKDILEQLAVTLVQAGCSKSHWKLDDDSTNLVLRSTLLPYIDDKDSKFTLSYYRPCLRDIDNSGSPPIPKEITRKLAIGDGLMLSAFKEPVVQYRELTPVLIKSFYKLLIEQKSWEEVIRWFSLNYPVKNRDDINNMAKEMKILKNILSWEKCTTGVSEIY